MNARNALETKRKALQEKLNKTVTVTDHWDPAPLGPSHKQNLTDAEKLYREVEALNKDSKDKLKLAIYLEVWEKAIKRADDYIALKEKTYAFKDDHNKTAERKAYMADRKRDFREAKTNSSVASWCWLFCCGSSNEPEASDNNTVEVDGQKEQRHDELNRLKEKYKDIHTDAHTHSNGYRRLKG